MMPNTIIKKEVMQEYIKLRSSCLDDDGIEIKRFGGWESFSPDKRWAVVDMIFTRPEYSKHKIDNTATPGPGPTDPDYYMGDGEYIKRIIINLEEYNWVKENIIERGRQLVVPQNILSLWRGAVPHIGNMIIHGTYNIGKMIGMAVDRDDAPSPDAYYIILAHRNREIIYDTMCDKITQLKGCIPNEDYVMMEKIFDANHPFNDSDINRKKFDDRVYTCIEDLYKNPCKRT